MNTRPPHSSTRSIHFASHFYQSNVWSRSASPCCTAKSQNCSLDPTTGSRWLSAEHFARQHFWSKSKVSAQKFFISITTFDKTRATLAILLSKKNQKIRKSYVWVKVLFVNSTGQPLFGDISELVKPSRSWTADLHRQESSSQTVFVRKKKKTTEKCSTREMR